MEEWNQKRASDRSIETMERIALDALEFADDEGPAFEVYARKHTLSVNEVVYYLNAYENGGLAGLHAIRNPDIIPPEAAQNATKVIRKMLSTGIDERVPLRMTDEGTAIGVYEIQQRTNGDRFLFPTCQFRLSIAENMWHLYWMRKFDAWWPYPAPKSGHKYFLRARIKQVLEDEYGCFWG